MIESKAPYNENLVTKEYRCQVILDVKGEIIFDISNCTENDLEFLEDKLEGPIIGEVIRNIGPNFTIVEIENIELL